MKKNILVIVLTLFFVGTIFAQGEIISPNTFASYYAEKFHGRKTANGEIFDMNAYTAAHRTLPFGTLIEVTNLENGKKVIVRINDRGPFVGNREIDVSKAAAAALDMLSRGVTRVSLRKIDPSDKTALGIPKQNQAMPTTAQAEKAVATQYTQPKPVQAVPQYNQPKTTQSTSQYQAAPQYNAPTYKQPAPQYNQANQNNYGYNYNQQAPNNAVNPYAQPVTPVPAPRGNNPYQVNPEAQQLVYIPTTASETAGPLWRIQLGSFTREENAMRLVVKLRKIHFEPAYEKTETHIRVVLYGIKPFDLEKVKSVLEENGFNDYILRQESW